MVPLVRCLGAGSCAAVSLAPKDHLTRLCDSVRPASSQVKGHPPHSSEGSRCPCLVRGITVLLAKDVMHISTGPALRAVPIAPCLHESSGGSPCSLERTGRAHSQLPRRLAHTGSVSGSVMRTQGLVLSHLSQLGLRVNWEKSKLLPMRISFLGMEFGFGQSDSAPHAGTRSVGVELLEYSWPRGLRKYAFPPVSLLEQTLCKVREEEEQILLVAPYWPTRTWFPELMLLVTAPPWQIPLRKDLLTQRRGTLWHPRPDLWKLHVWSLDGTRRF